MTPFKLSLYVLDVLGPAITVNVESSETVHELKDHIKTEKEDTLKEHGVTDPSVLDLYQVDLASDGNIDERVRAKLEELKGKGVEPLNPLTELSKHFGKESTRKTERVHVIVQLPVIHDLDERAPKRRRVAESAVPSPDDKRKKIVEKYRSAVRHGVAGVAPSSYCHLPELKTEQTKHPIYNGRPGDLHGASINVYNTAFGVFLDGMCDPSLNPTPHEYRLVEELFIAASKIYDHERFRRSEITSMLTRLLGIRFSQTVRTGGTSNDRDATVTWKDHMQALLAILEYRNEIGAGSGDPGLQGGASYRKWGVDAENKTLLRSCCCPSFIISIAGPHIRIFGGVIVDHTLVQPLTDYVDLGNAPTRPSHLHDAAKMFSSLKRAIRH